MNALRHLLRRAVRSLWENLYLNLVSTGVIAAALMLIGVYLAVMVNLDSMVESWDRDVHVSAYFHTDVPVDRRFTVKDEIALMEQVRGVDYISEADAAAYLVEQIEDIGPIVEELGEEVLPASLEITLADSRTGPGEIAVFVEEIDGPDFEFIDYGQEWVQRFNTFLSLLRLLGIVLGSLIFAAAVFLVGNTMHLVAYARRQELETMKLVGATWSFVALPFAIEGSVQGLLGALLAVLGIYGMHRLLILELQQALQLALGDEPLAFLPPVLIAALVLAGMTLGIIGCLFAIRRFWSAAP